MKVLNLLAVIGLITVCTVVGKTAVAVNEVLNGPKVVHAEMHLKSKEKEKKS